MSNQPNATGAFEQSGNRLLEIIEEAGGEWGIVIESLDGKGSIRLNDSNPFTASFRNQSSYHDDRIS